MVKILIKGCKKRVIYIKNTDSRMFEEAFLVLRCDEDAKNYTDRSMIAEAERIVGGDEAEGRWHKKKRGRAFFFALGMISATLMYLALGLLELVN